MTDFDIEVVGAKPARKKKRALILRLIVALVLITRAILVRPRLMIVAALIGVVVFVGTPHIGWDYQCRHATPGGAPCTSASWCAYYGFQGRRVESPPLGEACALVKFLPVDWDTLGGDLAAWAATQWDNVR